jgi:hypothetical protein
VAADATPSEVTSAPASIRSPFWLWPIRISPLLRAQLLQRARRLAARIGPWPCWLLAGVLIGGLPLLTEYLIGWPFARLVTAVLLTPILVAAVVEDSLSRALAAMGGAFAAHSLAVILLAANDPEAIQRTLPQAEAYWQESHAWITTGVSKEYDVRWWLPAHGQWFAAVTAFTYLSLGLTTFWQGLFEMDLMNYYVGRLLAHSGNPWLVLALGWHPWSVCRGIGYLFITFEVASLSCERLTATPLSNRKRRLARWLIGLSFLAMDCVLKFTLLEPIRCVLADNIL